MNGGIIIVTTYILLNALVSCQWSAPSFISEWYTVEAFVTGDVVIEHGLNEVPAKVDVQIKVVQNSEDFIFTGTGTAQRDDDYAVDFGGIVYRYNNVHVVLYLPNTGYNTAAEGGIAYTGDSTFYDGPASARGKYNTGKARVRAWKTSDFPTPLFTLSIPIGSDSSNCYKEQNHGSAILPDLVIAQVLLDDGYISEGQGNIFQHATVSSYNAIGGVVFGYNSQKVKMWAPLVEDSSNCNGVVYGHNDGWGNADVCKTTGTVTLKGYQLSKAFQTTFPAGSGVSSNDIVNFGNTYSLDTALVTVQVRQTGSGNGQIENMIFNGVGSAMPTGKIYSGVVYVYTAEGVLLYTPTNSNTNGYMFYLGDRWGNGQSSSYSRTADIIVTVYSPVCPDPSVPNTSNTLTNGVLEGSVVQYSCDSGYVYTSGYLTRTCSSGAWDGVDPVCAQQNCADPGQVSNATYTYTGLSVGSTVTYVCDANFPYEAGNLVRTCQLGGIWDGIPPVCSEQNCKDPGSVISATYTYTGLTIGSTVTYVCDANFPYEAGNLVRTCQTGGIWDGVPPVCSAQNCKDPGSVSNATYTYTGLTLGSTVTYVCDVNFPYEAGNLVRTCLSDGSWDGIPPVCSEVKCNVPESIFNTTYTTTGIYPSNTVTYTCAFGSQQQAGDAVRTCQADGTWSGIPIVCINMPTCTVSVPVTHTPQTLAESIEKTKKELTVDKKETNAYHRSRTSAKDDRPSATCIGTAGVVLLCSIVAALVIPDIATFFRHMQHYSVIYNNQKSV